MAKKSSLTQLLTVANFFQLFNYDFSPIGLDNENHNSNVSGLEASHHDGGSVSTLWSVASKEKVISNHSSVPSDFICLQEVFCRNAARKLIDSLKGKYPYIVHDVAWPVHDKRVSFLNSGFFYDIKFILQDS